MRPIDYEKVEELRRLADIPNLLGGSIQFIHPELNLVWGDSGIVRFGFDGFVNEVDFYTLDTAIEIVNQLRKEAGYEDAGRS